MHLPALENKRIKLEEMTSVGNILSAYYYSVDEVEIVVECENGRFVMKRPYSKIKTSIRRIEHGILS